MERETFFMKFNIFLSFSQILPGVIEFLQTKYLQEKAKKNKNATKDTTRKQTIFGIQKKSLKNNEKKEKRDIEINFKLVGTDSEFRIVSYEFSNQKGKIFLKKNIG